jgi:hypothetical protein
MTRKATTRKTPAVCSEAKKRGATMLKWDVSHKEPKLLHKFHGHPPCEGCVTAANELGEIRIQFHTVTDGHGQFDAPLEAFLDKETKHGRKLPEHVATDNPEAD